MQPDRNPQSNGASRPSMDGVRRSGSRPAQPMPAPAPRPRQQPAPQPQPAPAPRPVQRPVQAAAVPRQAAAAVPAPPRPQRRGGKVKAFLQTLVAILVILGVAAVIVALYLRYYQ